MPKLFIIIKSMLLLGVLFSGTLGFNASTSALGMGGNTLPHNFAFATKQTACDTLSTLDASQGCSSGDSAITSILSAVVTILSIIAGAIAVIMIIVSGLRYVTSGGDSNSVSAAKRGLIYALVGIAVAALAQFLVHFVLHNTNGAVTPCAKKPNIVATDPNCR